MIVNVVSGVLFIEMSCDDDLSTLYIYFNKVTLLSSLWETRAEVGPLPVDPRLEEMQGSKVYACLINQLHPCNLLVYIYTLRFQL